MDLLEFIVVVIVIGAVLYLVYYFLRGSSGKIAITRPVESRVDEYLDRRFQSLMDEWQLVTQPRFRAFRESHEKELGQNEAHLAALKQFEDGTTDSLSKMEARLDTLEKELAQKRDAQK